MDDQNRALSDIVIAALDAISKTGAEREFVDSLITAMADPNWERNRYYVLKEYLLSKLLDDLRLVQGASLRTINAARQYVEIATQTLGSMEGRHVLEIGPGRNLGAGLLWRYRGARFTGAEIYPGEDFNTWVTLNSASILSRILYGSFVENFNAIDRGYVQRAKHISDAVSPDEHIDLVRPEDFCSMPLPSASINFIYSNFTLEHIQDPPRLCTEIARLLKRGGVRHTS